MDGVETGRIKIPEYHMSFLEGAVETDEKYPLPEVGDHIRDHVDDEEYYEFRVAAVGTEVIVLEEINYHELEVMTHAQYFAMVHTGQFQHVKQ